MRACFDAVTVNAARDPAPRRLRHRAGQPRRLRAAAGARSGRGDPAARDAAQGVRGGQRVVASTPPSRRDTSTGRRPARRPLDWRHARTRKLASNGIPLLRDGLGLPSQMQALLRGRASARMCAARSRASSPKPSATSRASSTTFRRASPIVDLDDPRPDGTFPEKTGRIILSGGESLLDAVRERVTYKVIERLRATLRVRRAA